MKKFPYLVLCKGCDKFAPPCPPHLHLWMAERTHSRGLFTRDEASAFCADALDEAYLFKLEKESLHAHIPQTEEDLKAALNAEDYRRIHVMRSISANWVLLAPAPHPHHKK